MSLAPPHDAAGLLALIAAQPERMRLLQIVQRHGPAGAWVGAGFVRNAVWDAAHGYLEATPLTDVDVLYFAAEHLEPEHDAAYERELAAQCSQTPWSVRNQARMHIRNADSPYLDCADALCHWPEVCTAVAVRLTTNGLELLAPLGLDDLLSLRVRPTERFRSKPEIYRTRLVAKNWLERWPKLQVEPL